MSRTGVLGLCQTKPPQTRSCRTNRIELSHQGKAGERMRDEKTGSRQRLEQTTGTELAVRTWPALCSTSGRRAVTTGPINPMTAVTALDFEQRLSFS